MRGTIARVMAGGAARLLGGALLLAATASARPFDEEFWKHWGDGQAEISTYDLTYPRYGELRQGTAVTIFVTETFSQEARVKADSGVHSAADEFPVMKLNLVQDFPTGIYDYNLMTSSFVALTSRLGRPAGAATKVSFSSQEWCGHVWDQLLLDESSVRRTLHSYFDGEADRQETLPYPNGGIAEDALFHWVRGLAAPFISPGEAEDVKLLRSAERARMTHTPQEWETAKLRYSPTTKNVTVPAGKFEVETFTIEIGGRSGRTWTFEVEKTSPRRIVRWEASDGRRAELVASTRTPYWTMNADRFERALATIGLKPRDPRTP